MAAIAILDDSATNRHIYARLAAAVDGVDSVRTFANPREALAALAEEPADLIITDFNMPELDGAAFIKAYRLQPGCADIPIIVLTVYEERNFRLCALEAGATDFLLSPVDHHEFMTRVRNLLKLRMQQKIIEERSHQLERELESVTHSHEAAVRTSSRRLERVIDTVPAMISATDAQGRYVFVNECHAALFDKTPQQMVGTIAADVLDPSTADHHKLLDAMVLAGKDRIDSFEQCVVDATGRKRWFLTSKAPLRDGDSVHVLTSALEITDRKSTERQLMHVAYHDPLTNLPNRLHLRERLGERIRSGARDRFAIHVIDVDRFKGVNEALGFATGDDLIQAIAQRLHAVAGDDDCVAHFGGDEFVLLQDNVAAEADADRKAQDLLGCIRQPLHAGENVINPTASIGVSLFPGDGQDADELVRNASLAMHRAKTDGGDGYRFFAAGMNRQARDAIVLDHELRHALEAGEFELHYQPQIDLANGRIVGTEALLRWRRGGGDLIPPDRFLPYAEQSGLILPISEWVLGEACRQAAAWEDRGLPPLRIAVNMSPVQFRRQDVTALVQRELERSRLDPARLELELTENMVMQNADVVAEEIAALRRIGVQFSIDDFGTGYSSLGYIKKLPISRLKIDRSFIANLPDDDNDLAIVRTILALAEALSLSVTAEGVETQVQLDCLAALGCDEVQGYLLSRPLSERDLLALLDAHFAVSGTATCREGKLVHG